MTNYGLSTLLSVARTKKKNYVLPHGVKTYFNNELHLVNFLANHPFHSNLLRALHMHSVRDEIHAWMSNSEEQQAGVVNTAAL